MKEISRIFHEHGKVKQLKQGEILFRKGEISDGVYFLEYGRLGVYGEENDNSYYLSDSLPGDLVGEIGAVTGEPRTATVKAEEESVVLHLTDEAFHKLLGETSFLEKEITNIMKHRLSKADVSRITLRKSYKHAMDRVQSLTDQKSQLEELLRLREELSDMIVHDLRNPLGVIKTCYTMIKRSHNEDELPEHMKTVFGSFGRTIRRMQNLIDTLLDISRMEEKSLSLEITPINFQELVTELFDDSNPLAEANGIVLENKIPEDCPDIHADRNVLFRIMLNLLDNALKFTPENGSVTVNASLEEKEFRITLSDTGPGIPDNEKRRIFEKFTQMKGQEFARRGSGLGLAFCAMAVEAHNGTIRVEDAPGGKGSCFVVLLPADV